MANLARITLAATALGALFACGSGEPLPQSEADTAGVNRRPSIQYLRVEPAEPIDGDVLHADVKTRDPDGDRVEVVFDWVVGGVPAATSGPTLTLSGASKGTLIEVTATAHDDLMESEPAQVSLRVRNRRPRLNQARIEPWEAVAAGDSLAITAEGSDPDGDELEYDFQWTVNGEPIEAEGPSLSTASLAIGDWVQARVRASDGESESDPVDTARVRVVGGNPQIVSSPGEFSSDGVFRYTVVAEHPDGDRALRYELREAPEGMWVNPVSGEITWRPTRGQVGEHEVAVAVKDSHGAVTVQAFSLKVAKGAEIASPPAQRAR